MERAEFNRHSRARIAETAKDASGHATCNAGRAGVRRPSEVLHPTRSSDVLPDLAGACPYQSQRHRLNQIVKSRGCSAEMQSIRPV